MPASDPIQILLAHDHWASEQILNACAALTSDQFHRRFDIGPGSLHDTLAHLISAMRTWTDTLVGREHRPRPDEDGQRRSVEQFRTLLEESCAEFASEVRRGPLDPIVTRRLRTGKTTQITRGAVLSHVVTHGMHHRAQCLNMLRQLGVKPLPPSSVMEWTWLGEAR